MATLYKCNCCNLIPGKNDKPIMDPEYQSGSGSDLMRTECFSSLKMRLEDKKFGFLSKRYHLVEFSSSPSELRIISNVDPAFHFVPIIDDDDCEHFLLKMLS